MQGFKAFTWRRSRWSALSLLSTGLLIWLCCVAAAQGADEQGGKVPPSSEEVELTDVIVDGRVILKVRGTMAFPAKRRAAEIRQQIIATAKDESIPAGAVTLKEQVPNTAVLNGEVINYSTLTEQGLILHTTVGIGYETLWRQVEAMLKLAADRTSGLLKKPKPFVLEKALGDFGVTYELNAHCTDSTNLPQIYSALHRNILDVFNEYGVAIMTPSYTADPPKPKLVLEDQWYAAPAKPPDAGAGG